MEKVKFFKGSKYRRPEFKKRKTIVGPEMSICDIIWGIDAYKVREYLPATY